ncbi:hypothetical protein [Flaviaesturariibacter amylovorans]|uniref:Uncharacterized protein n=1 Tax=Flaviaesturariibacter amylovorans TaxID=1084520 RepID=A0ABP8HVH3_9BACT
MKCSSLVTTVSIVWTFLFSCRTDSLSKYESKGVDTVLSLYGGTCAYSVLWKSSTDENERYKKFQLEISGSDFVSKSLIDLETIALGIAYNFYKAIREDKIDYTHIRVLLNKEGQAHVSEYELGELRAIDIRFPIVEKIVQSVYSKQFGELTKHVEDSCRKLIEIKNSDSIQSAFSKVVRDGKYQLFAIRIWRDGVNRKAEFIGGISAPIGGMPLNVELALDGDLQKASCLDF